MSSNQDLRRAGASTLGEVAPSTVMYRNKGLRPRIQDLISNRSEIVNRVSQAKSAPAEVAGEEEQAAKLGWFEGVMVPCLLNIWGVIMFLRLAWVVGQSGALLGSLVIILSNVVTGITALSLCAICTNGEVKGGGAYFLISRSLGPSYGGAIGILFYCAQTVATSMYVLGFAETLVDIMANSGASFITGSELNDMRLLSVITMTALLGVALVGVSWYAKCQLGLVVILVISIGSVFIGTFFPAVPGAVENALDGFIGFSRDIPSSVANFTQPEPAFMQPSFSADPVTNRMLDFFGVFAVFFPAVTGIMAGANMSGDLKDPSHAIPKGTLSAIGVTFVSYLALLWFISASTLRCIDAAGRCPEEASLAWAEATSLTEAPEGGSLYNRLILTSLTLWAPLVYVGIIAATLSSALASLVGAPRILQSLAGDGIFPWRALHFFAKGRGANKEPIRAYFLTYAIVVACCLLGKLDIVAPVISNFFMISYAFTNYACFAASMSRSPSWRPSFKYYNAWLSLAGAVLCVVAMFAMDWVNSLVSIIIGVLLYLYVESLDAEMNWGTAGESRKYLRAMQAITLLQALRSDHVKTFRPQYLVLAGDPDRRRSLVKFVSLLRQGHGIMVVGHVLLPEAAAKLLKEHRRASGGASQEGGSGEAGLGSKRGGTFADDLFEQWQASTATDTTAPASPLHGASAPHGEGEGEESGHGGHHEPLPSLMDAITAAEEQRAKDLKWLYENPDVWPGGKAPNGGFVDCVAAASLHAGFLTLLQVSGLGRMRPNTVVMGYKQDWQQCSDDVVVGYESVLKDALWHGRGVVVLRDDTKSFDLDLHTLAPPTVTSMLGTPRPTPRPEGRDEEAAPTPRARRASDTGAVLKQVIRPVQGGADKTVDVWWLADDGGLTMLIPYLLLQSAAFRGAKLRVLILTDFTDTSETQRMDVATQRMHRLLHKLRIKAEVEGVDESLSKPLSKAEKAEMAALLPGVGEAEEGDEGGHARNVLDAVVEEEGEEEKEKDGEEGKEEGEEGEAAESGQSTGEEEEGEREMRTPRVARDVSVEVGAGASAPPDYSDAWLGRTAPTIGRSDNTWLLRSPVHRGIQRSMAHRMARLGTVLRAHSSESDAVFVTLPLPVVAQRPKAYMAWMEMLTRDMPPTVLLRGNGEDVLTLYT